MLLAIERSGCGGTEERGSAKWECVGQGVEGRVLDLKREVGKEEER